MPTVTVVVLAYERPELLQLALDGVAAQTRQADQIIIVDDASATPLEGRVRTPEGPFEWHRRDRNHGPADNAALGLRLARGTYVAMLNDDDVWRREFLERLSAALDADPEAAVAFCDHDVIDANGTLDVAETEATTRKYTRDRLPAGRVPDLPRTALYDRAIASMSFAVARREAVEPEVVAAGREVWDYFLTLSLVRSGRPAVYVPERLGAYRLSPGGISHSRRSPERDIDHRYREMAAQRLALKLHAPGVRRRALGRFGRHATLGVLRAAQARSPALLARHGRQTVRALRHPLAP